MTIDCHDARGRLLDDQRGRLDADARRELAARFASGV